MTEHLSSGHHGWIDITTKVVERFIPVVVSPRAGVAAEATRSEVSPADSPGAVTPASGLRGFLVEANVFLGLAEPLFFVSSGELRALIPLNVCLLSIFEQILLVVRLNRGPPTLFG